MADKTRVTHLKTKGFKGADLDEDIPEKVFYIGKNTSGKSTKAAAIALTLLGSIPFASTVSKRPGNILEDFGQGDTLTTAVIYGGIEFERKLIKSKKGVVSQKLRVDKQNSSATDFAVALAQAGAPKIVDIADFMAGSDQKKIDTLFTLFPLDADLKNLDNKIEKAKQNVSTHAKDMDASTAVIQRLSKSKNELSLPAGSLAEVQADIKNTLQKVKDLDKKIKAAEIFEAEKKATEKANAENAAKQERSQEPLVDEDSISDGYASERDPGNQPAFDGMHEDSGAMSNGNAKDLLNSMGPGMSESDNSGLNLFPDDPERMNPPQTEPSLPTVMNFGDDPAKSIQRIIDTMKDAGCVVCAALMVANQELKKYTAKRSAA